MSDRESELAAAVDAHGAYLNGRDPATYPDDAGPGDYVDRKQLARRLLVYKVLGEELAEEDKGQRTVAREVYASGDADAIEWDSDGETVYLGRVYRESYRWSATVDRGQPYDEWVEINHPEQIDREIRTTVNAEGMAWIVANHPEWLVQTRIDRGVFPAFTTALESRIAKAKGKWKEEYTDPATGERTSSMPAWMKAERRDGYLQVKPSDEGRERVKELLGKRFPELES